MIVTDGEDFRVKFGHVPLTEIYVSSSDIEISKKVVHQRTSKTPLAYTTHDFLGSSEELKTVLKG